MLVVNGVDAVSGDYLLPPLSERDVSRTVQSTVSDARTTAALRERHRRRTEDHLAPRFGIDETDLSQAGWGVVFAADADPGVVAALQPLLDLRRQQAAAESELLFRVFGGESGYRRGESKGDFLRRHGAGPGPVRPEVLPYYLLLVGGPEEIPFLFQYQIGVQHAVGRLAFDDVDQYAHYARNVLAAEARVRRKGPGVRFSVFAPRAPDDPATRLSAEQLAGPLADSLATEDGGWAITRMIEGDACKERLLAHLSSESRPDLLLTASHGVGFPRGHPSQRSTQGALICQDWPGPRNPVTAEHCLAAVDVTGRPGLDLTGMVAVCFACFGAGTPQFDDFARAQGRPAELATSPFLAALPQALLGREHGALAVVGHVDRAWSYSFSWPGVGAQTEVFRSLLARIGAGHPLGAAMSFLTDRHAELSTELTVALELVRRGKRLPDEQLAGLWVGYADARDFVVIGDPAVALGRVAQEADRWVEQAPRARLAEEIDRPQPVAPSVTSDAVEVATYVAADMAQVAVDPETGRVTGAELALLSSVRPDGGASHVVAEPTTTTRDGAAWEAAADIHVRLLEVSVTARRAWSSHDRGESS